jgi:fructose-1-phosphate kinase PfkB-like protein
MISPPPIFTLTANLLAERTLEFDRWSPGATQRATKESFQVGGKGINVSKMLNRLGAANTALCFAGGAPGAECEAWLRARNFALQIFPTTRATRTGTVVRSGQLETTFLGTDPVPDAAAIQACADFINTRPAGVLAVCGSIPGWASADFDVLRAALHRWPERGSLVVDTYGPALEWLVNETAALVRINRTELNSLVPTAEQKAPTGEILRRARDRFRGRRWVVTDGAAPVSFIDEHNDPEMLTPPMVRQVSATGSGDVMLGCLLHARFHQGLSWRDSVAWSLPWAVANAGHPGIAEFADPLPKGWKN